MTKPIVAHFNDDTKEEEALRQSPNYRDIDEEIKQRFTSNKNRDAPNPDDSQRTTRRTKAERGMPAKIVQEEPPRPSQTQIKAKAVKSKTREKNSKHRADVE